VEPQPEPQQQQSEEEELLHIIPTTTPGDPQRKGVPWTQEEHRLFLLGLAKFGKG
jgi:hypothetical protein